MVLAGIPGRAVWMVFCAGVGLLISGVCGAFSWMIYHEGGGLGFAHLPLGFGFLMGQAFLWIGLVTLAVGRMVLVLDTSTGTGEYRVRSPIIEAGKPCRFRLEDIDSIALETHVEDRTRGPDRAAGPVTVHRLRLRLNHPRRAIVLDETQNGRVERLEILGGRVAGFLGRPILRDDESGAAGDGSSDG